MRTWIKMALLCATASGSALAQPDQSEFSSYTWSWTNPVTWLGTTSLNPGQAGYYQDYSPTYSNMESPSTINWRHWRMVYYYGLTGGDVWAWADWGLPTVPPPAVRADGRIGDNCFHSHVAWGVWLQYDYYSGGTHYSGVVGPLQGGVKSGVRPTNSSPCSHSVTNIFNSSVPRYGWGKDYFNMKFAKTGNIWAAMYVGAFAINHGAMGCATQGCTSNPWIGAYSLPY
jgi:hypothetical protein